jgi:hypothetical protein
MNQYLTAALQKRNSDRTINYNLNLVDFVCQCYVNLTPNSYGSHIQEYIRRRLDATDVPASKEMGDFMVAKKYFAANLNQLTFAY